MELPRLVMVFHHGFMPMSLEHLSGLLIGCRISQGEAWRESQQLAAMGRILQVTNSGAVG